MKRLASLYLFCTVLQAVTVAAQHRSTSTGEGELLAQGAEPPHRLVVRKGSSMPSEENPAQKQP